MKKIRHHILSSIASIIALIAYTEATTACVFFYYQPEVPPELQK